MTYNALQQLIADHLERTGETYADIARRAGCPRQTVSAIMHKETFTSVPHQVTLDRLAKGLQVSRRTVRDAAARSIGLGWGGYTTDTPAETILLDLVHELPEELVSVLIESARAMVRMSRAHEDTHDGHKSRA
jgi:transcriptional regulator with XRE-family HTH domain